MFVGPHSRARLEAGAARDGVGAGGDRAWTATECPGIPGGGRPCSEPPEIGPIFSRAQGLGYRHRPMLRSPCVALSLAALALAACTADKTAATSSPATAPPPAAIAAAEPEPVAANAAPAEPAVAPPEPTPEPEPTPAVPATPSKVLILGDSLAATGFGALLEKKLDAHPHIECFRKAKSATGLARPDFYDWHSEAKKQIEARQPDLVVVIMGGNDGQDLQPKSGKGKRVAWKSDDWNTAYKERVGEFLQDLGERKVLWLGLPKSELGSFENKLRIIRQVQNEAVTAVGGTYVETTPLLSDESGELLEKATVGRYKNQTLREEDGIHFTMAGSEYFADKVYPEVLSALGVEDVAPEAKPVKKKR